MKLKWRNILIVIGLVLAVALLVDFNRRMEALNRMDEQLQAVRAESTMVMRTQEALMTQVAYSSSDSAVEEWAYEGKWVRVDEHPISVLPAGNVTPTPEPAIVSQSENLPNWRIWWELFFGESD
jgi:hypothetical protein